MPNQDLIGGGCSVRRLTGRGMVMIRAPINKKAVAEAISRSFKVKFPSRGQIAGHANRELAWMSIDECLGLLPIDAVSDCVAELRGALVDHHHWVADVSALRAEFEISGQVRDILAKGTPTDVSPKNFTIGDFRRSRIGQLAAAFWMTAETSARILCRRSESTFLQDWLLAVSSSDRAVNFYHPPSEH